MASDPTKICILGATFNTANLGVSVLAAGALRCVLHKFPNARITQLDYARDGYLFQFPFAGRNVDVRFANVRFSKTLYLPNNIALLLLLAMVARVLLPLRGLRPWALSCNRSLRDLQATDLVVSLAGGDSFSDIYGLRRLLYVSLPQILAIVLGKRLVILPQTIGPFQRQSSRRIARFILNKAELVYCRDRISESATRSLMGWHEENKKLAFCYDLGFDVDPKPPEVLALAGLHPETLRREQVVGFNVSGLLAMGGYSGNNMFGLGVPYEHLVLRLIESFIVEHATTVLLVPHVFGSSSENDVSACEHIFAKLQAKHQGKVGILRGVESYAEVKHVLGTCDFFVGSRMHACIGALSQSVPAVSIAYSDKFAGVMESIGIPDLVVDPRNMSEEEILQAVHRAYEQRVAIRRRLEGIMPRVKQTIQDVLRNVDVPLQGEAALLAETGAA